MPSSPQGIAVAQEGTDNRQRRDVFTFAIALLGIAAALTWGRSKSSRPELSRRDTRIIDLGGRLPAILTRCCR